MSALATAPRRRLELDPQWLEQRKHRPDQPWENPVDVYLRLLRSEYSLRVDEPTLRRLQRAHVTRIPYVNMDLPLGVRTPVEFTHCLRKVLAGRGGHCYELNVAFRWLLERLGFRAELVLASILPTADARVFWGSHMAIRVTLPDGDWLVDVGLGDGALEPLPLREGTYQQGADTYRVISDGDEWVFRHRERGSVWGYRVRGGVDLSDFVPHERVMSRVLARSPLVQTRTATGSVTLRGNRLSREDATGSRHRQVLGLVDLRSVLVHDFGLDVTSTDMAGYLKLISQAGAA